MKCAAGGTRFQAEIMSFELRHPDAASQWRKGRSSSRTG
jgi:hypothetical protein